MSSKSQTAIAPEQVESFISPATYNGMIRSSGRDRRVWLYAVIPWSPALTDGATDQRRVNVAQQLMRFFDGLASQVSAAGMKYRSLLKGSYREFHLLTGAVPTHFRSQNPLHSDLARWQNRAYADIHPQRQFALIGVPLNTDGKDEYDTKKRTVLQRVLTELDNIAYNIANGCPDFKEYLPDMYRIQNVMLDAGLKPFSVMDEDERGYYLELMRSWWVSSGDGALGVMPDNDHLHLFPNEHAVILGKHKYDKEIPCKDWDINGEYPATICFAQSSSFSGASEDDPANLWLAHMLEVPEAGGAGVIGVSVRGNVEPGVVTADQIRRNRQAINDAIKERYAKGREASGDMEEIMEKLEYKRSIYKHENMPPTLVDLSVAALVAGNAQQAIDALGTVNGITFVNMNTSKEQLLGFQSMQACSPVRMTPYNMEWSATMLAGSGVSSMAKAGDKDGACLGFTERNVQPVYVKTTFASDEDTVPFLVIVGKPGSGKTMALLNLMLQWSQIDTVDDNGNTTKTPCIFIDPKEDSDFSDAVLSRGGTVYSMDSDISNGMFDPLNVIPNREEGKEMAANMLANILAPSGTDADLEINITAMLNYGIKHGARVVGAALHMANQAYEQARQAGVKTDLPETTPEVYARVMRLIDNSQFIRIICGTDNNVHSLTVSQNLTLIRAGSRSLVPAEGSEKTVTGRIQRWVLRMTVMGAGVAVRGRDGVVALDEAWVALGEGSGSTVEQWGRLARSQRFLPVLASQKVQEFIDAGLAGSISRGLILANDNPSETNGTVSQAKAAIRLFGIDDTDGHIARRMSLDPVTDGGTPNWDSLQRLKTPDGKTIRGSVAYFKSGSDAPVPVEIRINQQILSEISTNRLDAIARQKAKQNNGSPTI